MNALSAYSLKGAAGNGKLIFGDSKEEAARTYGDLRMR